jgi:soluble cytochrome b562
LEKSAADIISDLPKAITLSDGTVIQPLDAQRAKVMKDGKDLGVEMGLNPDLKEEDQVKLYEQKLLDLRKAVAPLEIKQGPIPNITPTAPTVAPAADAAPEASAQLITESSKEVTSMFRVSYHSGNTIEDSYFVGSDGTNIKVVSAARVIPADLQEQIAKAEAENKEIQDLIAPEEAEKQIADAVGNSMEGFTEWAKQLPKITRSASLKKSAEWAINESEIPKVEMPKKGTVIDSVCPEEKKQGLALTEVPKGTKSPIKKFYGRLPGEGGGEVTQGLNLQSQISKTYQLMKQALEEKEQEVETLKSEKGKVEKEFGDFKEKDDINKTKGLVDNVLAELKKLKPVAPEKEKDIVDILSKVGSKGLGQLMEIINIVSAKEDKVGADLFGGPAAPKGPAGMPPLPPKPASQRVVGGVDLPATYPSNDSYSLTEVVTGIFESTNK